MAVEQHNGSYNGAPDVEFCEVTREQLLARVDRGAKRRLGLSGWEEFSEKYHCGLLPDTLAVNELSILLTPQNNPAFERNAREFARKLSQTLTTTISLVPLRCEFLRTKAKLEAILEFRPSHEDPDLRYVELENGCWINILQRLVPNSEDPRIVSTAKYSYSCSLGPEPDEDWLIRYDYVPQEEGNPDYPYPVSHVHINAKNETYDSFMGASEAEYKPLSDIHLPTKRVSLEDFIEHLIVEFDVPPIHGKTKTAALEILKKERERFQQRRSRS